MSLLWLNINGENFTNSDLSIETEQSKTLEALFIQVLTWSHFLCELENN